MPEHRGGDEELRYGFEDNTDPSTGGRPPGLPHPGAGKPEEERAPDPGGGRQNVDDQRGVTQGDSFSGLA